MFEAPLHMGCTLAARLAASNSARCAAEAFSACPPHANVSGTNLTGPECSPELIGRDRRVPSDSCEFELELCPLRRCRLPRLTPTRKCFRHQSDRARVLPITNRTG